MSEEAVLVLELDILSCTCEMKLVEVRIKYNNNLYPYIFKFNKHYKPLFVFLSYLASLACRTCLASIALQACFQCQICHACLASLTCHAYFASLDFLAVMLVRLV